MLKNEAKERARIIDGEDMAKDRKKIKRRKRDVLKYDKVESGVPLPGES